jgi:hypothetical protein
MVRKAKEERANENVNAEKAETFPVLLTALFPVPRPGPETW